MRMSNWSANSLGLGFINGAYGGHGFGSHSFAPAGRDCPATGDWNQWCDCMFAGDANLLKNCKRSSEWTTPGTFAAPWTDVGSSARGIPKEGGTGIAGSIFGTGGIADQATKAAVDASAAAITGNNASPTAGGVTPGANPTQSGALPFGPHPLGPNLTAGFTADRAGAQSSGAGLAQGGGSSSTMSTGMLVAGGLLAAGAALFLFKKKKGGSSLGSYRRRSRRSRR